MRNSVGAGGSTFSALRRRRSARTRQYRARQSDWLTRGWCRAGSGPRRRSFSSRPTSITAQLSPESTMAKSIEFRPLYEFFAPHGCHAAAAPYGQIAITGARKLASAIQGEVRAYATVVVSSGSILTATITRDDQRAYSWKYIGAKISRVDMMSCGCRSIGLNYMALLPRIRIRFDLPRNLLLKSPVLFLFNFIN